MNRILLLPFILVLASLATYAQQPDAKTLQETARTFTRQGDYANAIVVLNGAVQKDPQNIELLKDLAFNYYLQRDYSKGLNIARPLTERPDADVQCYQMTGLFYKAIDEPKECEKLYKAGIKRFPRSGVLYNEYGEMLWARQEYSAIKQWEKGIEIDPNYSSNYYNAAKHYFLTYDKVWSIIYGEIFVNLESYSRRTAEIKDLLLEGYKKLFAEGDMLKNQNTKSPFVAAYLGILSNVSPAIAQGVTAESLTVLRTKFILAWFEKYPAGYPFRLFDYQRQLLKDGLFDAYNEWIFGAAENLPAFQTWSTAHGEDYSRFTNFQKGRIFKLPEGQYYQATSYR
ncbi:MAG TPA: tetratricopeptide repeat protein [Puia sp.]